MQAADTLQCHLHICMYSSRVPFGSNKLVFEHIRQVVNIKRHFQLVQQLKLEDIVLKKSFSRYFFSQYQTRWFWNTRFTVAYSRFIY